MYRFLFLALILIVGLLSCNNNTQKNKNTQQNTTVQKTNKIDIVPEKENKREVPIRQKRNVVEDRAVAADELKNRLIDKPEIWEPLVINYYTVDFISDGQGAPKDVLDYGEWYKFNKDFTYMHGFLEKVYDRGQYSIDIGKKILLMLPDDNKKSPSEWKILISGDVIVMNGTPKFGNNPIQKHCQNIKERPESK